MKYTYYVEGVGIEVTVEADTQKEARNKAWAQLSDNQKNNCACLDLIDME